ncbi:MAG: hypothetical protein LBJ73_03950 [Rickettsiales bacterium]|nr:hypothetical protein [Rickettsiales bacterium]
MTQKVIEGYVLGLQSFENGEYLSYDGDSKVFVLLTRSKACAMFKKSDAWNYIYRVSGENVLVELAEEGIILATESSKLRVVEKVYDAARMVIESGSDCNKIRRR